MENITTVTAAAVYFNNAAIACWLDFSVPLEENSNNDAMLACKHLVNACKYLSVEEDGWRETLTSILDDTPDVVKALIIASIKDGDKQVACDAMASHLIRHHLDVYMTALGYGIL